MRPEVVETAAGQGVSLIISVDTGIRAAEVVRRASELSIDVIITDHHLPEAELPPALAVLNPNRPDCDYPEKNLCGVGVAFKLVQALLGGLDWPKDKLRRVIESFLKLVAIATVADVVPLTGENRIIVKARAQRTARCAESGLARATRSRRVHWGQRSFRHSGRVSHRAADERRGPHGHRQRRH